MTIAMLAGDQRLDAERRAGLRRMRLVAVGLLVLAAVVYLLTLGRGDFWGFVNAGAEASMVGAIADWFAVTALFRHPLGIPVPHTALIPRRKEMLGRSLEGFVAENFLHEEAIRERVAASGVTRRVGEWLAVEANSRRVVLEAGTLVRAALVRIGDDDVASIVSEAVLPRLASEPLAPAVGGFLAEVVSDGAHRGVVDLLLLEAHRWLGENEAVFVDVVSQRAPWWSPGPVRDAVSRRVHRELLEWIRDVHADLSSPVRIALDRLLADLAESLLHDPVTQERAEAFKARVLAHPQVVETSVALWRSFRTVLVENLAEGMLVDRLTVELRSFAEQLSRDEALQRQWDAQASDLAVFVVDRYGGELTAVITQTIDRWDGREAARRIELHVGKDLQFIRINGTIVGGLVGVLIHTVTVLVG
jgi:uncharacterized membrane-anchored protein YjiN (DUF445 family)